MFTKQLLATNRASYTQGPLKYACNLAVRDGAQVIVVADFAPAPSYMGV